MQPSFRTTRAHTVLWCCKSLNVIHLQPTSFIIFRAYGFAGTIAGAVLESSPIAPQTASDSQTVASSLMIFVVSAKTQNALVAYIHSYIEHCSQAPPSDFHSICYTSCVGREHYRHRFACVVRDMDDLICRLQERLTKIPPATLSNPQLVLGFPGQGNQYLGMSGGLALRYPGFRAIITEAANAAAARTGFPVLSFLLGSDTHYERKIDESEVAQVCIFIHQYSISRWLNSLGLHPASVIGHSIGEIAAAGMFSILRIQFTTQITFFSFDKSTVGFLPSISHWTSSSCALRYFLLHPSKLMRAWWL